MAVNYRGICFITLAPGVKLRAYWLAAVEQFIE
jgi:hypothetical protein